MVSREVERRKAKKANRSEAAPRQRYTCAIPVASVSRGGASKSGGSQWLRSAPIFFFGGENWQFLFGRGRQAIGSHNEVRPHRSREVPFNRLFHVPQAPLHSAVSQPWVQHPICFSFS